jgi:diacylglycerol kinase (ATP)
MESQNRNRHFAIFNPAAGGGRPRKQLGTLLDRLRLAGLEVDIRETSGEGDARDLAREAWRQGYRKFISIGGDGTSYEIVNGLFPLAPGEQAPTLAFLPLGTGNSFVRDFSDRGLDYGLESLVIGRARKCDVLRLAHKAGVLYYINILSLGFSADVASLRTRRFRGWGEIGYQTSIFVCLARCDRRPFPLSADGETRIDTRPCLFLTFNNTKFTGGTMMIAPSAESSDGFIEYVRWGPIGRLGLIRNLPGLYDGSHIQHPLAEVRRVQRIDFYLNHPVDVMIDGEVVTVECHSLDVLPGALTVVV